MGGIVVSKRVGDPHGFFGLGQPLGARWRNLLSWSTASVPIFGKGHQWDANLLQETTSFRTRGVGDDGLVFGPTSTELSYRELRSESDLSEAIRHGDIGHPFLSTGAELEVSHPLVHIQSKDRSAEYLGPVLPDPAYSLVVNGSSQCVSIPAPSDLIQWGAKGIARTAPTNPLVDMAQDIGEIMSEGINSLPNLVKPPASHRRQPHLPDATELPHDFVGYKPRKGDILPGHLVKKPTQPIADWDDVLHTIRGDLPRGIASVYLNQQFGIGPLVDDIQNGLSILSRASQLLKKYRANSGVPIRRRLTLLKDTSVLGSQVRTGQYYNVPNNSTIEPKIWPPLGDGSTGLRCKFSETITETRRVWFEGCFVYHLPDDHSIWGKLESFESNARYLLGLRLTPELLWELTPWTWLADWVFNIGDVLHNISIFQDDALVLKYGYVMSHVTRTRSIQTSAIPGQVLLPGMPSSTLTTYTTWRKERIKATPYGFGLDPTTWSSRRFGILGALGLTRGPRQLF